MSRTLILVKPDAFERGLSGEIIARFERKGLRIAALKLMQVDRDLAEKHYSEHSSKPFFPELIEFITRGPLVAMVLEGEEAVPAARSLIGATNPVEATPGLDPRRLRARGHVQPRARLRLGLRPPSARSGCGSPSWISYTVAAKPPDFWSSLRSPQRRAILTDLGVPFEVCATDVEEERDG